MKQRIISLLLATALILTILQQISISVFAADNTAKFKSVTAHGNVTAAITTSGDLYMWGKNDYGQVGNGTTTDQETPVKVLSNVASASINVFNFSDSYCAAITTNGDLYMWGYNAYGQVGNGTTTDQKTPFKVLSNVASISIDGFHSAAITTNGDLYMWGRNQRGQVGNGATTIQKTPVKVLSNVASVSISSMESAAITANGDLYMWGYNAYGKVGNGTTTDQKTPVKVLSNIASVNINTSYSAAITTNGDLYMWGCNDHGQIGNDTTTHQKTPVKVLSNVASISMRSCSAAITTNGDLYTWGANNNGQVGNGTTTDQKTPVKVLSNVEFVNSGWGRNAAITTNGDLYMWGLNHRGQVGNGTTTNQKTPLKVLSNVVSVTPYDDQNAAITTNGDLYLWGYNNHGQVGNGTTSDQKTPLKILSNIESVDLELFWRSAAITTNGDLYMWGFNNCGQVGNGTTADQLTPYQIVVPDSSATSNDSFNTFFVNNYYDNLNALYNYESVAQGIKTSSFQIVWNNCLQALSNSNYIDISKLENHPEYYYEVVLVEAISQKELNDDYLSALKTEAFDLVLDAADVFISYDANFNSHEEILEAKLTETINLFDGTSEGAHALYQAFMGCVSYKSYKDFYDEAKFVYDACKEAGSTCSDFLTELSNYQVAQQASAEVIEALKYLRSTLEDSSDKEEKNIASAIDDFIQLYSESIGETALRQASEAIDEQLRGTLFRAAKLIPIFGNAVDLEQAGLNAVFTFSDVLFPTTMSSENYCKIYADYAMECVLRNAMQSACSSRSTVGDDVIVGLYDLLGFTYKHEIQVAQVLAEQLYHDGLLNGLRNLFTDREERYNYDKACIKAYQADLYQILGEKTDAFREYGFAIGTLQPVTIVYFLNGKVIDCKERTVETGSTFSPSSVTANLGFFLNTKIEIASYYTDAALTKPYNENQSIYSPLSLYCNLIEIDFSINVPIIRDYSTGIYVEQNGIDETAILQTQEKHDGASYDLISSTLNSNAFSLYDISLMKNGVSVQPTKTVTVRIPLLEADTQKTGKVYRVESSSCFTDMSSWIEGDYYCFETNHFSEYVVAFETLPSKVKLASSSVDLCIYDATGNRLVRTQETNLGDFSADAMYYLFNETEGLDCDLALIPGGAIRNNLPHGDVTNTSCKSVMPFGNLACLITVTGQQIIDALEWGARNVGVGENGSFLQVSGVTFEIRSDIPSTVQQSSYNTWAGAPTGSYRVQNVKIYDKALGKYVPIDLDAKYNLAGDNYTLCNSGYGFEMFDGAEILRNNVMEDYLVLVNYVKSFPNNTIEAANSVLGADYSNINGEGRIKIVTIQCEHSWNQGETTLAPTCIEMGEKTFICTKCGQTKTEKIAALGHNWDNGEITIAPTMSEDGVRIFTCIRCGVTKAETIAKLTACDGGVNCPSNKFIDVNQKEWYHPYVDYAVTHGLFGGTSENTFEPDSTMTRSMLVTVLWRYEGQPKGYKNTFADVNAKNGGWYIDAVAWAAANNIVGGVGGGKFDPEGIVTREQMATILYRYSEWKGFDTSKRADFSSFPDANKVSSWAKTAMKWAVAEGLIGGSKEGNATYILPTNGATRAQVATILMRYIQGATNEKPSSGESYHIALITDYGDINDASYNQAAYEAGRAWCEKNSADFTYYKPIEDSTEARVAVIDQAVADGYNVLILPGFTFADPIVETAGLYPDVRFIGLDISEDDLKFAAYDNPTYTCPSNVFCALYKEEIGGFMAGYAAVKLGYTKLGFLGGMPVPAVVRYGYGFIQGVDTASTELGIKTEIRYVYGNQFFGDADITAYMENWYRSGTQVVFACGGGIFTSVAEAAQKYSGKLIGVDVDQSSMIDGVYGRGITVTSAMKGLGETVTFMLDELISGRWNVHGGKIETLGLISGSDPSANFVQLPDSTQWNSGFTKSDYAALVSKIYNGTYIVSADIDIMPTTKSVTVLNEGAIKS